VSDWLETKLVSNRIPANRLMGVVLGQIYGDSLVSPQRESYWGNANPIGPRYSRTV
jgi:hypothetical protein